PAKLPNHIVRDPHQQEATGEDETGDLQQLGSDHRKGDEEDQRHADAEKKDLAAVLRRESGRKRAHDDDIVAGHGEVADDDLNELGQARSRQDIRKAEPLEHFLRLPALAVTGSSKRRSPRSIWHPSSCPAGTASRPPYPFA